MKDLLFIEIAVVAYFFAACAMNRLYKWMFPLKVENSSTVRESIVVISVLMTDSATQWAVYSEDARMGASSEYMEQPHDQFTRADRTSGNPRNSFENRRLTLCCW